jgi:hypothetical protein
MLPRVTRTSQRRVRFKKLLYPMCKAHYMENTFGLWPYRCTKACFKARDKEVSMVLDPRDLIVWLSMEPIMTGCRKPQCPWCSRPLKQAQLTE